MPSSSSNGIFLTALARKKKSSTSQCNKRLRVSAFNHSNGHATPGKSTDVEKVALCRNATSDCGSLKIFLNSSCLSVIGDSLVAVLGLSMLLPVSALPNTVLKSLGSTVSKLTEADAIPWR